MTPLRQRMTEDMLLRGLAPAKVQAYLRYVEQLALFTGKSPDLATDEDFRQFFLALHKQRGCSRSTATVAIAAFKFLFEHTLQRPWPRPIILNSFSIVTSKVYVVMYDDMAHDILLRQGSTCARNHFRV
jgi:hypothetical protein